ncbi:Uu.00g113960.m01.CDS01 [Anthostomella pinea]|uniref:Uu.00g113960.m01.CDS01 n=1 Tax=Anthostomella pinea TaxID=933095 RepID=A0AAI8VFM3_9PEZI|nr:Uu.00g113960.m01.CDS01 [Anthostomella pinea]
MADEPTLPSLPTVAWDSETQTFRNTRKRNRDLAPAPPLFSNSSDPAVFSSDDDPNVDNYAHGRHRKKRYVGSWYQQQSASSDSAFSDERTLPAKGKRTFERQVDSGVWMGSDSSLDFEDDMSIQFDTPAESKLPQLKYTQAVGTKSPTEDMVRLKIQTAIDNGDENIDLSSLDIKSISNATIAQLNEFSCIPLVAAGVPFEQKEPELKLYLFNNPLQRAPGALFNLEYLTVLSLRNAQISKLPPSIGKLRNLETLNLSLNRLRYLPAELLDLVKGPGKLRTLNLHPNPFHLSEHLPQLRHIEPKPRSDQHEDNVDPIYELEQSAGSVTRYCLYGDVALRNAMNITRSDGLDHARWEAIVLARSPVEFSDSRGVILSKFQLPQEEVVGSGGAASEELSSVTVQTEALASRPSPPQSSRDRVVSCNRQSRVPSLLELALQSCSRTGQLRELPSYLPLNAPPHFAKLLDRIAEQGTENENRGDVPCSVCKRRVVVPMTQWIEWCDMSQLVGYPGSPPYWVPISLNRCENAVPFLRRGCSWNCVPQASMVGQPVCGVLRQGAEIPKDNV